ncbi:hypothetical protein M5K25_014299 [Dendrobium thyrsiflorum]|uniref:Uncharacterized protein n=1 Tax=Dendrobium thyrsiflorum TaxID=117978 RepID=A0ABD0UW44_DENTH
MSTAVLPLPKEVASYSSHTLPPLKKPSKRKPSKSRPSTVLAADESTGWKSPNVLRHPDSPIMATKIIRTNARKSDSKDLVMEEVRILKRGEAMRPLIPPLSSGEGMESFIPCLTDRLGPDPMVLPKPSVSAYAGPAYISSPSPSSLPVPFFLNKAASRDDDVATRSIRCLLRLDASL